MQVLLRDNVKELGRRGDVVTVKDGYARNYLLPKGMAVEVRRDDLQIIEVERKRLGKMAEKEKLEAEGTAEKLQESSVTITAKANEEGHLFGSVGPEAIAEALTREIVPVEPSAVQLDAHIKELGVYDVKIRVSADLEATTKVWVVGE